jgi:hypothetical protein
LFKPNFTNEILEESLIKFQAEYNFKKLLRVFDLTFIKQALYLWQAAVLESKIISANSDIAAQIPKMQLKILDWEATLEIWNGKVTKSYHRGAYEEIYDLAHRAAHYFESEIDSHIYQPLQEHLEKAKLLKSVKGYLTQVEEISYAFIEFFQQLSTTKYQDKLLIENSSVMLQKEKSLGEVPKIKVSTYDITKILLLEGKTVAEVSKLRAINESTIYSHILKLHQKGDLDSYEAYIDRWKIEEVKALIRPHLGKTKSELKDILGEPYAYLDINFALYELENEVKEIL